MALWGEAYLNYWENPEKHIEIMDFRQERLKNRFVVDRGWKWLGGVLQQVRDQFQAIADDFHGFRSIIWMQRDAIQYLF